MKAINIILISLVLLSSCIFSDNEPPNVYIIYPGNNTIICGEFDVIVEAYDNENIESVSFYIDGEDTYTDRYKPWKYTWNSSEIIDGSQHTICAKSVDGNNNIAWSNIINITINSGIPIINTLQVDDINSESAICRGEIVSGGSNEITEYGICWGLEPYPTIGNETIISESNTNDYYCRISNLRSGELYYYRAYASNLVGTGYGQLKSFITYPEINSSSVTCNNSTKVDYSGRANTDGRYSITDKGICWSTNSIPTINDNFFSNGTGSGYFSDEICDLIPDNSYNFRVYATNESGTEYGEIITIRTNSATFPIVETNFVENSSELYKINCSGSIVDDGENNIISKGFCWSTASNPTIDDNFTTNGSGNEDINVEITGLILGETYYFRAYATNQIGTAYGNEIKYYFYPISDINGNIYKTIKIGDQIWMTENLRVKSYRNGDNIDFYSEDNSMWGYATDGARTKKSDSEEIEGYFYNSYAVNDGRNIAPQGWRIPNNDDWQELIDYLEGTSLGAWGFDAILCGYRNDYGTFKDQNSKAYFWSSTKSAVSYKENYYFTLSGPNLSINSSSINSSDRRCGMSVRCIKNQE